MQESISSSLNPESRILNPHFSTRLRPNADLSKTNWFRVGGCAEWLFKPEDAEDLAHFLRELPPSVPVIVLGVGSNVIVRDGGIDGVVIKLGRGFAECRVKSAECIEKEKLITEHPALSTLEVGAGCLDVNVAQFACDHSIAGMEFLCGVPGTIGGAVKMNAGAYGREIKDVLLAAEIVTREGEIKRLSASEINFSYRSSALPEGAIVTRAWLRGSKDDPQAIATRMQDIQRSREETQPIRSRTGGSTFKNPPGHKAWELIDRAGCRGLTLGGAQVSEKHCNFLINTGSATAADIENLGEEVIRRVREKTGITLEWEIKRIGNRLDILPEYDAKKAKFVRTIMLVGSALFVWWVLDILFTAYWSKKLALFIVFIPLFYWAITASKAKDKEGFIRKDIIPKEHKKI